MLGSRCERLVSALSTCLCLMAATCAITESRPPPQPASAQAPNPAARKCLDDGYQLEPVRGADGVVVDHRCIDQRSGRWCEVWEYFRGTCRLREEAPSVP